MDQVLAQLNLQSLGSGHQRNVVHEAFDDFGESRFGEGREVFVVTEISFELLGGDGLDFLWLFGVGVELGEAGD